MSLTGEQNLDEKPLCLYERVIEKFKERRQKILDGNVNSIPSPFKRFSNDFVGLEQGCYMIVTSYTKGGKSQFTSYLLFNAILFTYFTKADIDIKILYFNLEETKENVMTRFISWLLYERSDGKYRISPRDLLSSKNDKPLSQEIIDFMEQDDFKDLLAYFESKIIFPEQTNPTGIYKSCRQYAEEHGKILTKPAKFRDENGIVREIESFDRYIPDNPNEYVFAVVDTINIIDTERGYTKKQAVDKMSEYFVLLRNRYNLSPIVIQQQNTNGESIDSIKLNKNRPAASGLGDSTYTSHDCNLMLGIFSPFKFGLKEYLGYPIDKFKDHFRTLEVIINRNGELGGIIPLFFDGATSNWFELPKANDIDGMEKVYNYLKRLKTDANTFFTLGIQRKNKTNIFKTLFYKLKTLIKWEKL